MARTIHDLETNKNAVIFWHMGHPPYEEEKPYGCVIDFHGYCISADIYTKGFTVFSNRRNFHKEVPTLKEAKQVVLDKINKERNLFCH